MKANLYLKPLCCLMLTLSALPAWADKVWMKNGDVLSGTINLVDENKLVLSTKYASDLTILVSEIKTFSMDNPAVVKSSFFAEQQPASQILPSTEGNVLISTDKNSQLQPFAISDKMVLVKEKENAVLVKDYSNKGSLNAGGYYNKGSSKTEQYSLTGELITKYDLWRNTFDAAAKRTLSDGTVNTYYYNLQDNLDRFFSPKFFWQNGVQYKHDWIEDIKTKRSVATGPGYQVWDDPLGSLSLAALVKYQVLTYHHDPDDINNPLYVLNWDFQRYFNGQLIKFYTKGSVGRGFSDDITLELESTVGLAYKLTNWLSLTTSVDHDRDRTTKGDAENTSYNVGAGIIW